MKNLPSKPSALLVLALKDLVKCEKDKRYIVAMLEWHRYCPHREACYVCLGGAVMANTLKTPPKTTYELYFETGLTGNERKLKSLDYFRTGMVDEGLRYFGISSRKTFDRSVASYHGDREEFLLDMKTLIKDLRGAGY